MSAFQLRPMRAGDADEVYDVTMDAFAAAAERAHGDAPERRDWMLQAQRRRVAHSVTHDPDGCWVAEGDGELLGAAIALLRENLWILSLLMVRGRAQGQGVGRALLDRALGYAGDRPNGVIAASDDPFAWRRYGTAGFRVSPAATVKGVVRRDAIPAVSGVRAGGPEDYELCHELSRAARGAAHGPDLAFLAEAPGGALWVADAPGDRGFVTTFRGSPGLIAAERPETAQKLLWSALAEAEGPVEFYFLTGEQQWAFEVAFAAGLTVRPGSALFTRGDVGRRWPYLPNGPFL